MTNFITLGLYCAILVSPVWGQAHSPITKVVDKDGWVVPAVKNAHLKPGTVPHFRLEYVPNAPVPIEQTIFLPARADSLHTLQIPYVDFQSRLIVLKKIMFRVMEIRSFEVDNIPYCYRVTAVLPTAAVVDGTTTGASLELYFIDEDGSGKMTLLDTSGPVLPNIPLPSDSILKKLKSTGGKR